MFKFILLCLSLSLTLADHYPFTESNHIILLGDPNWHYAEDEYQTNLLVYYYEPWCLPCREFWPKLLETAGSLFDVKSAVQIARIDCHDEVVLCDKHGIKHFPTLLLHRRGNTPLEYTGGLHAGELYEWARKFVDSVYQVIDDEETLFDRHSAAILVSQHSAAVNTIYKEFADEIEIAVPGTELKNRVGTLNPVILTQGGDIINIQNSDIPAQIRDKLNDVFYNNKLAVPSFSLKTTAKMQWETDQSFVFYFKTSKITSTSLGPFNQVAKDFKSGPLQFYYVNVVESRLGQMIADLFGVTGDSNPCVGIMTRKDKLYYKYKMQEVPNSVDVITSFLNDYERAALKPYYMSAEIPDDIGYVKELVGKNYDNITRDEKLNVFVMLYFPWCEECVKVEPTWTSLAYRVRNHQNVVIARMDMSKNDLEGFSFSDYPVFLFYPEGPKEIIQYKEDRRMSYLQDFLGQHVKGLVEDIEL